MSPTPSYGWPIPTGVSPVNVPGDLAALGNAIDAEFADSGWVDVAVSGGKAGQGGTPPQVRKIGNRIYARWGWANTGIPAGTETTVGTVPAGYRPARTCYLPAVGSTGNQYSMFTVAPGGTVTVRASTAGNDYYLFAGELAGWFTD